MNGNSGIVPTVDLATNNNNGYPVYPIMGGFGNGGFGGYGSDFIWVILLLALFGGNWGNNGNGFFGGRGFDDGYAWLSNGQKEIMQNTNQGFDTLHLSNQLDTVNSGIYSLSNQLCNCCAEMNQTVNNGFFNAEISNNNRQMANMNQLFGISNQLCNASADNRLGIQDLKATVISENCSDREVLRQIGQEIMVNQTANTQKVLDVLCQNQITELRDRLADRDRELQTARFNASQVAQTADIRANNAVVANQLVSELRSCPIPAQPVYGNQPIFTCQSSYGCGCGNNLATNF